MHPLVFTLLVTLMASQVLLQAHHAMEDDNEIDEDLGEFQGIDEDGELVDPINHHGDSVEQFAEEEPQHDSEEDIDEENCARVCPRMYRPLCALRNGELVTYASSCEYDNEVRCAVAARQRGGEGANYQVQHEGSCEEQE